MPVAATDMMTPRDIKAPGSDLEDRDDTQHAESLVRFRADRGDARLRLDQALLRHIHDVSRLSRSQAQRWIEAGAVTIDGRPARRASSRVREGAEVAVRVPAGTPRRVRPAAEDRSLDVVYEDASLIALNKPPGTIVHPSYRHHAGTLLNAVLGRLRDRPHARPGILTRLDKDTSGLVVIALDAGSHAAMQHDAAAGRITKEYLAVVRGVPRRRHGRIVQPLARDPHDRRRMVVAAGGAYAETHYEVVAARREPPGNGGGSRGSLWISLLRCALVTGRTHQIRVHLAWSGWPILGDRTYGEPHARLSRQALHAWRVTLPHPRSRDVLTLLAAPPDDFTGIARTAGALVADGRIAPAPRGG